jgi:hypothetical protein
MDSATISDGLAVGIDVGTTAVRAVALDASGAEVARAGSLLSDFGPNLRNPAVWQSATIRTLQALMCDLDGARIRSLAVDGTSGTILAVDTNGTPLGNALMYNDVITTPEAISNLEAHAPATSATRGPTSGLLKAIRLQETEGIYKILHQADWIAGCLSGRFDVSDENNALKTGYDPIQRRWPDWLARTSVNAELLPEALEPGTVIDEILPGIADSLGISRHALIVTGTTNGCASFLATGAESPGDAVTSLSSTLILKILSDKPLFAPEYGLYSHRLGNRWLTGGASNSGGKVLAKYFTPERIAELSAKIDPGKPTGFDYYPLAKPGERFPVNDPELLSRMNPRPLDEARFLQAMLEGITGIEVLGYQRLKQLGAPKVKSLRTVGGGAQNATWTAIRQHALLVPLLPPASLQAAAGTARLALSAARTADLL